MAHPRRGPRIGGVRRQVTWVGPADQGFVNVGSTGKTLVASFDPNTAGFGKPTIVRTRGMVSVGFQAHSVDVIVVGVMGMAIVSDQAFAIGVTAIPGPFDQAEWDGWLVWRSFSHQLDVTTDVGRLIPLLNFEVDSKAMRKVSEGETVVVVAQSQVGAFAISTPLRQLYKLA